MHISVAVVSSTFRSTVVAQGSVQNEGRWSDKRLVTVTQFTVNVHHLGIYDLKIPSSTGLLANFWQGVMILIKRGFARTHKVYLSTA
jgi:hypothetical protein